MKFAKLFLQTIGFVAGVGAIVTAYVVLDDWYSKRVQLDTYATGVAVDSSGVLMSAFSVTPEEYALTFSIEQAEGEKLFENTAATMRMPALMGYQPELLTQFNLATFRTVEKMMEIRQTTDSLLILAPSHKFTQNRLDSIEMLIDNRAIYLDRLKAVGEKYWIAQKGNARFIVRLTVANSSSAPTAILGPLLLRVNVSELEAPLFLSGSSSQMEMFGMRIAVGGPVSVIPAHSSQEITLVTETAVKLGNKWSLLEKAFAQSNSTALVKFYTVDKKIRESETFLFSADFADQTVKKRLKILGSN